MTLIEVLMSIMILSIGIISLATLFPISVLRYIQAAQLTKGTILRYNAEATIDTLSRQMTINGRTRQIRTLIFNPNDDGDLAEHVGRRYIVDPIGWNRAAQGFANVFGNDGDPNNPQPVGNLARFPGAARFDGDVDEAFRFAALPDSWGEHVSVQFEVPRTLQSVASPPPDQEIVLPTSVDLSDVPFGGNVVSRIVLFSVDGRSSHVRTIQNISGQAVQWNDPLPARFQVGSVRIQTQEFRYTWLLTVRTSAVGVDNSVANIDVVVLFRRPDPPADEQVFTATFTSGSPNVTFTGSPDLKKGGFLLDVDNARWYRIEDFTSGTITLARDAVESSPSGGGQAIFMPSVVNVYPIGQRELSGD